LVVWLLDEKGADVNATTAGDRTPLFYAKTPDILTALLDRGADPCTADRCGALPLMWHASFGKVGIV
jgi:ankyrin repeat protein